MNELQMMITIVDRDQTQVMTDAYRKMGINKTLIHLGFGTAADKTLDFFGLEATEKVVIHSFVTYDNWNKIKKSLLEELRIGMIGAGIAFVIPISSVGGKSQLEFLLGGQEYHYGEESEMKGTDNELIVVISNTGYADEIMDTARRAGARGGTVLHAKGTGMKGGENFLGVTLASEKEMIYILTRTEEKNSIMTAVMEKNGINSPAQSILFSLPVRDTAGVTG